MLGPVVSQAIEDIRGMVERGETLPAGRLPSERDLAEQLGVSRFTVRAALAWMRDEGWVEVRRGRSGGAYVREAESFWERGGRMDVASKSSRLIDRRAGEVRSLSAMLAERGIELQIRVVRAAREVCPADVCACFGRGGTAGWTGANGGRAGREPGSPETSELFRIERVRSVGGVPLSFEQTYVDPRRFPRFLDFDLTGSIFDLLCGPCAVQMARVEEKIEVVAARGKSAHYLGKDDGYPLLRVTYQAFDAQRRTAVVSRDAYNPELVCFTVVGGVLTERRPAGGRVAKGVCAMAHQVVLVLCTVAFVAFALCGFVALRSSDGSTDGLFRRRYATAAAVAFALFMLAGAAYLVMRALG